MDDYNKILDTYDSISVKTGYMVNAAKNNDWDTLIALEKDCSALAENLLLREANIKPAVDRSYLERKAALIHKVLADDAEIRRYTEPWMKNLSIFLDSSRKQSQLFRAYRNEGES